MEHINDYSLQSQDWNAERLNKLKELFPDWFTNENQLNLDEVKKVINPKVFPKPNDTNFVGLGKATKNAKLLHLAMPH